MVLRILVIRHKPKEPIGAQIPRNKQRRTTVEKDSMLYSRVKKTRYYRPPRSIQANLNLKDTTSQKPR